MKIMKGIRIFMILLLMCMAASMSAQTESPTITMMTYNIKGHGITSSRLENIGKVINYWVADIVALQEVDNRTVIGMKHNYLGDLAELIGMHSIFLPCVGTYYGVGLLTKDDTISVTTKVFPFTDSTKDKEDRGVIVAEFKDFYFMATHYSLNANDRDTATKWIIDFAQNSDKAVFVAGDFNAQPTYRAMVTFKNNGFKILNDVNTYTYPSTDPKSCIDMVLCYGDFEEAKKYEVVDSGICSTPGVDLTTASDHLPVFVELKPLASAIQHVTADDEIKIISDNDGLRISGLKELSETRVMDINGRLLKKTSVEDNGTIDMTNLSKGIYMIEVKNNTQKHLSKYMLNK